MARTCAVSPERYSPPMTTERVVTRRITCDRQVAVNMAKAADLQDLLDTLTTSAVATLDAVDILTQQNPDGSMDLVVEAPTGCMVGWYLDERTAQILAIPGGEPDLHLTLAYLGEASALSPDQTRLLTGVVAEWCAAWAAPSGSTNGVARLAADDDGAADPFVALVDIPGLAAMQADLVARLTGAGLPVDTTHDFLPHITLAWLNPEVGTPPVMLNPVYLDVDDVSVCVGGMRMTVEFTVDPDEYIDSQLPIVDGQGYLGPGGQVWGIDLTKAAMVDEDRYTLAPWYIPDTKDAHAEWTDARELQKALWKYTGNGDRDIRLQHNREIVAGEWVEAMQWPHAVTVPVIQYDGAGVQKAVISHTYPAGTCFLGVRWEPWAWSMVKSGDIQGLSIGGTSDRIEMDLVTKATGAALVKAAGQPGVNEVHIDTTD